MSCVTAFMGNRFNEAVKGHLGQFGYFLPILREGVRDAAQGHGAGVDRNSEGPVTHDPGR